MLYSHIHVHAASQQHHNYDRCNDKYAVINDA